jgi:IS66 Orf2 like protein
VFPPSLGDNPVDGAIYVFRTRAGTTLKLLAYDGQGLWLCPNYPSSYYTSFGSM